VNVVGHDDWLAARKELLAEEKAFTRARDELTKQRQSLPWEAVETEYVFDGPNGRETLAEVFDGRSQLVVYHFMFPAEDDAGCPGCSFWADNFDGIVQHLAHRDVTMVAISRAPYPKLADYEQRMGWSFKWLSSGENEFNYDFGASFRPEQRDEPVYNFGTLAPANSDREGISVFGKEDGAVFRTYSTFARGIDLMNTAYNYLDLVPKGRDEDARGFFWLRRHDEY
jgi:predicted dithiol-disulfide oxidoreductase (DUF899 family)